MSDPMEVTTRESVRGRSVDVTVDHGGDSVYTGYGYEMRLYLRRGGVDSFMPYAEVDIGDGYEHEPVRIDDPAELRELANQLATLADVWEAAAAGEWVPPASPGPMLGPEREPRPPSALSLSYTAAARTWLLGMQRDLERLTWKGDEPRVSQRDPGV